MLKLFTGHHGSILPIISLLLFFALFSLIAWYLISDRRRAHNLAMSRLPLADDASVQDQHHA